MTQPVPDWQKPYADRLQNLDMEGFSALKVLVAGDFILDEYLWGKVERISPEAPVAIVEVERETRTLGGAGNVVHNLVGLGAQVEVLGLVGQDNPGHLLKQEMTRLGVPVAGLFTDPTRRTSRKTRVIGAAQQIMRLDRETRTPASPAFESAAREFLRDRLPELHALVVSDYGKGVLTQALLRELITQGRHRGCPVVVDPKGADYSIYSGATLITPNRKEAEMAAGCSLAREEDLLRAGSTLRESLSLEYLLITLGAEGMLLFSGDHPARHIPTRAREVFDVSGAGDTVVALMALGLARWGDAVPAAILANAAAGVVVGKIGTAPILRTELARELGRGGSSMEDKIRTPAELSLLLPQLQAQGKKVVFTNGCFDLLHGGHIKFLEESRRQGDILVVALDSDDSVRTVKGEGRPVIGQDQRLRILAALSAVDYVTLFTSSRLPELLAALRPDILTKGSNYSAEQVASREIVQGYGGEIKLLPIDDTISISNLIERIRNGEKESVPIS